MEDVRENFYVCPKCGGYFRVHAWRRLQMVTDPGTFEEWDREMEVSNPLNFPGYEKKLEAAREKSRLNEAIVTGCGRIGGNPAVIGVCDARFLMSSMGHNVGEKITRAVERATREKLPVVLFACSGGARMQEGIVSLMQMAKTAAALKRHHDAGQLFVSVLTGSHHRRRHRQLRHAGRYHPGGAGGPYRLCGPQGHRADHRPEAAGGVPESRVSSGARLCG